jgi:hypothetical protein
MEKLRIENGSVNRSNFGWTRELKKSERFAKPNWWTNRSSWDSIIEMTDFIFFINKYSTNMIEVKNLWAVRKKKRGNILKTLPLVSLRWTT